VKHPFSIALSLFCLFWTVVGLGWWWVDLHIEPVLRGTSAGTDADDFLRGAVCCSIFLFGGLSFCRHALRHYLLRLYVPLLSVLATYYIFSAMGKSFATILATMGVFRLIGFAMPFGYFLISTLSALPGCFEWCTLRLRILLHFVFWPISLLCFLWAYAYLGRNWLSFSTYGIFLTMSLPYVVICMRMHDSVSIENRPIQNFSDTYSAENAPNRLGGD
jgi:hypothetical protein